MISMREERKTVCLSQRTRVYELSTGLLSRVWSKTSVSRLTVMSNTLLSAQLGHHEGWRGGWSKDTKITTELRFFRLSPFSDPSPEQESFEFPWGMWMWGGLGYQAISMSCCKYCNQGWIFWWRFQYRSSLQNLSSYVFTPHTQTAWFAPKVSDETWSPVSSLCHPAFGNYPFISRRILHSLCDKTLSSS